MKKRGCSEKDEFVIVRGNTMSEGTQEMRQEKIEYFLAQAQQYHFTREYSKAMEFYIPCISSYMQFSKKKVPKIVEIISLIHLTQYNLQL